MSRSIHTTRRSIEERHRMDDSDKDERERELSRLKEELGKKRRIKAQINEERRGSQPATPVGPESIQLEIVEQGEHIHYPATPSDLEGLLRCLPPGQLNGLSSISLSLGRQEQIDPEDLGSPDPLLGRESIEVLPGVFGGCVLGIYHADGARIQLFAYVYKEDTALRGLKELYVRLLMLSTLAHELAHHHDFSQRVSRGRWRADEEEKTERYAEGKEHDWAERYVIPYLVGRYPDEVAALLSWLEHHGGAALPLGALRSDPRVTEKGGLRRLSFYSIRGALRELMEDVEEGQTLSQTRINFARNLHYEEHYDIALRCLARVLIEEPQNTEALTLEADIHVHEGKYEHAEALCKQVIMLDPAYLNAWEVIADTFEARGMWCELLFATEGALALSPEKYWRLRLLRQRGHSLLMMGYDDELMEVIKELPDLNGRLGPSTAIALECMRRLMRGELEAALSLAVSAWPTSVMPGRTFLEAVRFDAAHQLGRPQEAGTLSDFARERLKHRGFFAWADRLGK